MVFKTWGMNGYYNELKTCLNNYELNQIEFSFKDFFDEYVFNIKVIKEDNSIINEIYFLDELVNKIYINNNSISSDNIMLNFHKTIIFSQYEYNSDVSTSYSNSLKHNIKNVLKTILKPYYDSMSYDSEINFDLEYFYIDEYENNVLGNLGTCLKYYSNKYNLDNSYYLLNEYDEYGTCIFIKNDIRYNAKFYLYDRNEFLVNNYETSYKNKIDKNIILNTYNPKYELDSKIVESEYFNTNDLGTFTYKIVFNLKNNTKVESTGYIKVIDDVKPILEGENNISTLEGEILNEEYIKSLFYVYDDYDDNISSKLIIIDYDKIDFNTPGDYYIKIKVSDNFNNESIEDIKVSVFKKIEPEPTEPIIPDEPDNPSDPVDPVLPEELENPVNPENPVDPVDGNKEDSEIPDNPINQNQVDNPNENIIDNNQEEIINNNEEKEINDITPSKTNNDDAEVIIDDISIKDDFVETTSITLEGFVDKKYDKFDLINMLKNNGLNLSSDCEISSSYFDENNIGLYEIKIEDNGKTYLAYLKIKNDENNFNPTMIIILGSIIIVGIGITTFLIIKKRKKS